MSTELIPTNKNQSNSSFLNYLKDRMPENSYVEHGIGSTLDVYFSENNTLKQVKEAKQAIYDYQQQRTVTFQFIEQLARADGVSVIKIIW